MADKEKTKDKDWRGKPGGGNAVYCLGLIGALVFYIQEANGAWQVILAFFKAIVWPAFVVYDLLKFLTS